MEAEAAETKNPMRVVGIWAARTDQPGVEEDQFVAAVEVDTREEDTAQVRLVAKMLEACEMVHQMQRLNGTGRAGQWRFYAADRVPTDFRETSTRIEYDRETHTWSERDAQGNPAPRPADGTFPGQAGGTIRGSMYPATAPDIADWPPRPE